MRAEGLSRWMSASSPAEDVLPYSPCRMVSGHRMRAANRDTPNGAERKISDSHAGEQRNRSATAGLGPDDRQNFLGEALRLQP